MVNKATIRSLLCPSLIVLVTGLWYVVCTLWHVCQFPLAFVVCFRSDFSFPAVVSVDRCGAALNSF